MEVGPRGPPEPARDRAQGRMAAKIAGAARDVLDRLESEREWLREHRAAFADYLLLYS